MEEINIRRAVPSDLPYLYEICLKTGDAGNDATELFRDPFVLGQHYAAPYLLYPAGICFVAEHECRPQGYIVAAPDTLAFRKWMEEQWLPPLRKRYPLPVPPALFRSELEQRIIEHFHVRQYPPYTGAPPWFTEYPAHLHIDLLPGIQRKGRGRALVDALFAELTRQGVSGLHLGVSAENPNAIAFYQKVGFTVVNEFIGGFTFGRLCGT